MKEQWTKHLELTRKVATNVGMKVKIELNECNPETFEIVLDGWVVIGPARNEDIGHHPKHFLVEFVETIPQTYDEPEFREYFESGYFENILRAIQHALLLVHGNEIEAAIEMAVAFPKSELVAEREASHG